MPWRTRAQNARTRRESTREADERRDAEHGEQEQRELEVPGEERQVERVQLREVRRLGEHALA